MHEHVNHCHDFCLQAQAPCQEGAWTQMRPHCCWWMLAMLCRMTPTQVTLTIVCLWQVSTLRRKGCWKLQWQVGTNSALQHGQDEQGPIMGCLTPFVFHLLLLVLSGPIIPDIPHQEALVPLQLPSGLPSTLTPPSSCDLPAMHEQDAHQKAATQPLQAAHKAAGPGCMPASTMPTKQPQPQPQPATAQQQQQHASSQQPPMVPTADQAVNTVSSETDPNTSIRQVLLSRPLPPPPLPLIQPWVSDLPQLPVVTTTAHAVAVHGPTPLSHSLPCNSMVMGTPPLGSLQQQQQPQQAPQPPSGMPPPPPRPLAPLLPRIDGIVQGTEADSLAALRVCLPQAFTLGELAQLAGLYAQGMITLSHDTRLSVVRAVVGTGVLAMGPGAEQHLLLHRIAALFG